MRRLIILALILGLTNPALAASKKKPFYCPVIVDTDTSEFIKIGKRYQPLKSVKQAQQRGFSQVSGFGDDALATPQPTAVPSNNFVFRGSRSENSVPLAIGGQTLVEIKKSKGCYMDVDLREQDGSIAANVINFPYASNVQTGSTYVYENGVFYIDVFSDCDSWTVTIHR